MTTSYGHDQDAEPPTSDGEQPALVQPDRDAADDGQGDASGPARSGGVAMLEVSPVTWVDEAPSHSLATPTIVDVPVPWRRPKVGPHG